MNAVNLEAPADAAAPDMVMVNGRFKLHKHYYYIIRGLKTHQNRDVTKYHTQSLLRYL
jgi:hypothetical protein